MLKIENFTKKYGNNTVVDNLTLNVENGDIFAFVGHNGAGKTTTIKSVVGILEFDSGTIMIDNKNLKTNEIECKKMMAYVPDNPDLYNHLKGIDYLNFIADIYEVDIEKRNKLIEKYAKNLEIDRDLNSLLSSYSHGMKQKVAIISALIHEPKLLILDEPFVGLDPKATHDLKEIFKEMASNGCAIFFSTHILEVAEKLCNKIAIIKSGKLVISGEMQKIVKDKSLEDIFMELEK